MHCVMVMGYLKDHSAVKSTTNVSGTTELPDTAELSVTAELSYTVELSDTVESPYTTGMCGGKSCLIPHSHLLHTVCLLLY